MLSSPLTVVHVGCGSMASAWLKPAAEHPGLRLVGFVDLHLESAEQKRDEFAPGTAVGTDVAAMLAELKPDIVFNCTIPEAHHPVSMAAFAAGAHVLCEKPLAHSVDAAREMVEAAANAGRTLAVTQNRRYFAGARAVRDAISADSIGRITGVNCDFFLAAHFGGFRDEMEHVLLIDMAIHHFDLARFLCGESRAERVFCHEWNPAGSWYRHGANVQAIFTLEGGAVFSYRGSWCAEGAHTDWNGAWRITGTKGTIIWDGSDSVTVSAVSKTGGFVSEFVDSKVAVRPHPGKDSGHASIIGEFFDCVSTAHAPETSGAQNVHSLEMVFAAIESARTQVPVQLTH